jgi:iron complex transport system permease protein
MKIVLDVDRLLHDGRINREEYDRLKSLAAHDTGSLAFNILVGFGVIATAGGILALLPGGATALLLGLALAIGGLLLSASFQKEWGLLGAILVVVGSITTAGSILVLTEGSLIGFLTVAAMFLCAAVVARSGLLAAMSVLALASATGGETAYGHAMYMLAIYHPTLTVGLFSVLSLVAYVMSQSLPLDYRRLALIFSRTSLFIVNLGFWIGSLWGDSALHAYATPQPWYDLGLPPLVFVIGWAVGLLATGIWGAATNKRWVVNLAAVFGAIHFYTQYFELLGPRPEAILFAGLLALAIAFAIVNYNKRANGPATQTAENRIEPQPIAENGTPNS